MLRGTPHTEEMIRYEFNPIRNMKITYMGVPMGILGLALVWYIEKKKKNN